MVDLITQKIQSLQNSLF